MFVVSMSLIPRGSGSVLARDWHGQVVDTLVAGSAILCLQSTCTLAVTVACLGVNFLHVCHSRLSSGPVAVRRSGQTWHEPTACQQATD